MRRGVLVLAVLAIVGSTSWSAPATTDSNRCDTTGVVAVGAITGASPTCSFTLTCDAGLCGYAVRITVQGGGIVEGSMAAQRLSGAGTLGFPRGRPFCMGVFVCSAGTQLQPPGADLLLQPTGRGGIVGKVTCNGGGLAVIESISCSATLLEIVP